MGPAETAPLVSFGIGVALSAEACSSAETGALAFRLASLARANAVLVSEVTYRRAVDRFDFCGVGPVVPRSDPLPGPVFELLGPKPERSGTHFAGPERVPILGRAAASQIHSDSKRRNSQGLNINTPTKGRFGRSHQPCRSGRLGGELHRLGVVVATGARRCQAMRTSSARENLDRRPAGRIIDATTKGDGVHPRPPRELAGLITPTGRQRGRGCFLYL